MISKRTRINPFIANNGHYFTQQLFHERTIGFSDKERTIQPMFTLHKEVEGLICFGKEYVATLDPSGYKVTQTLLNGDYKHWTTLMGCSWFKEAKEEWDKEIEARLFAEGMDAVRSIKNDDEVPASVRLQAARMLVQKGYKEKVPNRGRPSKEEVQGELKRAVQEVNEVDKDLERIKLVKNG